MFPSRPLLILQMRRPPEDVRSRFGEQPDWFRIASRIRPPLKPQRHAACHVASITWPSM